MANIRLIRGRIKSAKNISQITKAMELVSASKMRKAQASALSGKRYASKIYEMVMELSSKVDYVHHPLLTKPKKLTGKRLVVFLSSNKGLCGGLNTNLFRFALQTYKEGNQEYITIGKKGATFVYRVGKTIIADFSTMNPVHLVVSPLTDLITKAFLDGQYDGVDILYSEFISALKQNPRKKTLLPLTLDVESEQKKEPILNIVIEPNAQEVFDSLLPHYLENQIRDAVHQAEASEHSARMVAMRNATDNAVSLTEELTLLYNKARQEKITYEITDMVTARLATE